MYPFINLNIIIIRAHSMLQEPGHPSSIPPITYVFQSHQVSTSSWDRKEGTFAEYQPHTMVRQAAREIRLKNRLCQTVVLRPSRPSPWCPPSLGVKALAVAPSPTWPGPSQGFSDIPSLHFQPGCLLLCSEHTHTHARTCTLHLHSFPRATVTNYHN